MILRIILLLFFCLPLMGAKKFAYPTAICAIFQDEADYLQEWIEYHRLLGINRFYLYNHHSTDHFESVLKPYRKKGIVKLINWKQIATDLKSWNHIQCKAYEHCINNTQDEVDWLAIIDIDEFIVLTEHESLKSFLEPYFDAGGLSIHWQMFGTSHVNQIPPGQLLIETLTLKAPVDSPENETVKTFLRPRRVKFMINPHTAEYFSPWFQMNTLKQRTAGPANTCFDIDQIRINHYWSRDETHFFNKKAPKRLKWGDTLEAQLERLEKMNVIEDKTILRRAPALKASIG